jgi:hypothetical protein
MFMFFVGTVMCPNVASCSLIVVLRTPDSVLIGADGKAVFKTLVEEQFEQHEGVRCKLRAVAQTAVAIAGFTADFDGYSALEIATSRLSLALPLEDIADEIARAVTRPLEIAVLKMNRPGGAESMFQEGNVALSITLARFEAGVLKVTIREIVFTALKRDAIAFEIRSLNCPGNCSNPRIAFAAGEHEAIDHAFRSRAFNEKRLNDANLALEMLGLESAKRPDRVGPPFSVLRITSRGLDWIQSGACASSDSIR